MHVLSHKDKGITKYFLDRKFCDTLCFGNRRVFRNSKLFLFLFDNKNTHLARSREIPKRQPFAAPNVHACVMCYCTHNKRHLDGTLHIQLASIQALSALLHHTLFTVVSNVLVAMKHFSFVFKLHKPKIKNKWPYILHSMTTALKQAYALCN
jgi:hypothetical protein